jgi:S1-C subfamily serine protease
MAAAQTGIETELWEWTQTGSHHNAVVKVETESGSGTGVLVHVFEDRPAANGFEGICLTAEHVVSDTNDKSIKVLYHNGKRAKNCKVLSTNEAFDLALLWVWVPSDISPAALANSAMMIGHPLEFCGLGGGSSLNQMRHFSSVAESPTNLNQIFASTPLLPGDSGGPVFNVNGEVVGVISGGWFWFDGGVKTQSGKQISVTWPARACHLDPILELMQEAIASKTTLAKN